MTPADFRRFVEEIAARVAFPVERLILGGDHLGPNPWKALPAEEALARAEAMVGAYVDAGFRKIHLDTSMGCAGEPEALADELTAARAARLGACCRRSGGGEGPARRPSTSSAPKCRRPAAPPMSWSELAITEPAAAERTLAVHRDGLRRRRCRGRISSACRNRRPAGRRIRQRQCRDLPARACARPQQGSGTPAGSRLRSAFDRLPACGGAGGPRRGRLCHPQGGTRADLRPARGALRSRRDRRRADGASAGGIARADHGAGDARKPGTLEIALSRNAGRAAAATPFQLQRPHPLLLARSDGRLPRWIA